MGGEVEGRHLSGLADPEGRARRLVIREGRLRDVDDPSVDEAAIDPFGKEPCAVYRDDPDEGRYAEAAPEG